MKDMRVTQKDIARKLNISDKTICCKLSGKRPLLWREVVAISKMMGIANPLEWFD